MKHLVLGAGATLAEAIAAGAPPEFYPPLIRDFARKTWSNYTPHPLLEAYLNQLGHRNLGEDPRELFYELEERGLTDIEQFMEFLWENRNQDLPLSNPFPPGYIYGARISAPGSLSAEDKISFWENFLYHGIGSPLSFFLLQCFWDGGECKNLELSKSVSARFESGDLVLNLNYDTLFEIALTQGGRPFKYSPNQVTGGEILVCKPHGSLNMVVNDVAFTFGQPEWLGMPQPQGFRSYSGIIPPRMNKCYAQHPIVQMILAPVVDRRPEVIVMWGVGLTSSDADLIALYSRWSKHAAMIDVIDPDPKVAEKAQSLFNLEVRHFVDVAGWLGGDKNGP